MVVRENVTFVDPPPLAHDVPAFRVRLEGGELRIEMVDHFPDEHSAKNAVTPFLDGWEMDAALGAHRRDFWFRFERAEVIDRSPSPPSPGRVVGFVFATLANATLVATATVTSLRTTYPAPPRGFLVTGDVRHLWDRYEAAIDGREPATSAGYYCYTVLTALAPSATKKGQRLSWVAQALSIDEPVLRTLNALTNKGDATTARKHSPRPEAHTGAEVNWLRMAVRVLTRRVGEWEYDREAKLPQITMNDLPSF